MNRYNKLLISFMESKANNLQEMCTIPKEWYFQEGDREEILSWSDKEAKKYWEQIEKRILRHQASGITYELCPFCYRNEYNHAITVSKRHNPSCMKCGYGKRHGICTKIFTHGEEKSQFQKILQTLKDEGINIYKTFSNGHYKALIEKLKSEIQ